LDPACGSGAFLIKAYDKLKRLNQERIKRIIQKNKHNLSKEDFKKWEKEELPKIEEESVKKILTENVHGVDLNPESVELTKVNLWLRSIRKDTPLNKLENNIACGNSLISGTEDELKQYFGDDWKEKRPFGGFDVVIGNPPYIENRSIDPAEKEYLKDFYSTAVGQYDYLVPFIEKAASLLKDGGIFGFIVSNKFMATEFGIVLRKKLIYKLKLEQLIDVSHFRVFKEAAVYPIILIFKKSKPTDKDYVLVNTPEEDEFKKGIVRENRIPIRFFKQMPECILSTSLTEEKVNLIERIMKYPKINPKNIACGMAQTGFSKKIVQFDKIPQGQQKDYIPMLQGSDVDRYYVAHSNKGIPLSMISNEKIKDFKKKKILIPGMVKKLYAGLDQLGCACGRLYYITEDAVKYNLKYLLTLFNSKLWAFIYETIYGAVHLQGDYLRVNSPYLGVLPIFPATPEQQNPLIKLVDKMLSLNKELQTINTNFFEHVDLHPKIKDTDLGFYFNQLGMNDRKVLNNANGIRGKIKKVKVREEGDWLFVSVDYVDENDELIENFDVLKCRFENPNFQQFIKHCILNYRKSISKGNLLERILKINNIPIFNNRDKTKNQQVIDEIMGPFLPALKRKEKIEKEIEETDRTIDQKVYELYGLTDEEIRIIEEASA